MTIQDLNRRKEKFVFPAFAGLAAFGLLLWLVFLTIYITYITVETDSFTAGSRNGEPNQLIAELERSSGAQAASGSGSGSPSSQITPPPPTVIPTSPPAPTSVLTVVPTSPARSPTGLPTVPPLILPTKTTVPPAGSTTVPTSAPAGNTGSSGGSSSGSWGAKPGSGGQTAPVKIPVKTSVSAIPTPTPIYPRIKFKVRLPDVPRNINIIGLAGRKDRKKAEAVFFKQDKFSRLIRLSETKVALVLRRMEDTDYFAADEFPVKIRTPLLNFINLKKKPIKEEEPKYAVFIKTGFTLGRLFRGITIRTGKSIKPFDCVSPSPAAVKDCGELITMIDVKPLLSGDADGFLDGSPSYNLIDARDLELWAIGQMREVDLAVLERNYGERGDSVDL